MNATLQRLRNKRLLEPIGMVAFATIMVGYSVMVGDEYLAALWAFFGGCVIAVIIVFTIDSGGSDD